MNRFVIYFGVIIGIGMSINSTYACSCLQPVGAKQGFEQSDVIFAGKVVSMGSAYNKGSGLSLGRSKEIQFEIYDIWKGDIPKNNTLLTADNGAACGYHFTLGQEYLVYAGEYDGKATISLCSNTKKLQESADDIIALNLLTQKKELNNNERYPQKSIPAWIYIIIIIGISGTGIFVMNIKRKT